jgi:hypothetical protein
MLKRLVTLSQQRTRMEWRRNIERGEQEGGVKCIQCRCRILRMCTVRVKHLPLLLLETQSHDFMCEAAFFRWMLLT